MNQCGACGRRECRKLGLDAVYVEFRDVGVGNVRREGAVAEIDVDESCLVGASAEILGVSLAPVIGEHSFAMEADVPSDIFYAAPLTAYKGSVGLDGAAVLIEIARVERSVFDRIEQSVNLVAFVFGFVAQLTVAAGRTRDWFEKRCVCVTVGRGA